MERRALWLFCFVLSGVACGRTRLSARGDPEGSGGEAATGGTNLASGGTALGGTGASSGTGGGSTRGGSAGAAGSAVFGGSGGAGAGGAGSGGNAGSDDVLGCDDTPVAPPSAPCERFAALGYSGVESPNALSLVPVRSDGSCVSVVTERTESGVRELAAVTFMPWKHWPTVPLGPLTKIPLSDTPSSGFTAAASDDGRLALAWQKPDGELAFGWDLDSQGFAGTYVNVDSAERSYASATSAIGHTLLTSDVFGLAIRTWVNPPGISYSNHQSTCADGGVVADVEPFGDGFLIASSTGGANTESHGCPHYPDLGGPPTRIMVARLSALCCSSLVAQWSAGGVVTRIRTAPHPDGTWIVWRTDDGVAPVLRRARVTLDSSQPIAYEMIGEPWAVPGVFDAVIFGSRLAVAWVDSFADVRQLRVTMIGNDGIVEDFTPQLGLGDLAHDDISVVAGPEGTGLVVGLDNGQLRRLDCQPAF